MTGHVNPRRTGSFLLFGLTLVAAAAQARPAAPAAPPPAGADLPERVIEKKDGDYVLRLTLRPGSLKTNRVANVAVEIFKNLDIPDPVTGSTMPMAESHPVAVLKTPEPLGHGKPSTTTRYTLWSSADEPGTFAFHFTPADDGIYELTIKGVDAPKAGDDAEPHPFEASYRIGAGNAAAQTEQTQTGTAVHKAARRPVGYSDSQAKRKKLAALMTDIGYHYLGLDAAVSRASSKAGQSDAMAEAKAITALLNQAKGLAPDGSGSEFERLLADATGLVESVGSAHDAKAARAAYGKIESVGCDQCHAKYRFDITEDLSNWPKFPQKAVNQ
jgi:hypothetical protein